MSEKLTRIRLPGQNKFRGLMDRNEQTADAMIAMVRRHAAHLRSQAEAIEKAADSEFQIDVVRGAYVQHHVREVQKSSPSQESTGE